jgi:predicted metal-binding membrane protein
MFGTIRKETDSRWYIAAISGLVLAAWGVLAWWGASPFAGLLDHGQIGQWNLPFVTTLLIFVLGWTLMTIAMMLPGSMPLIHLFQRMVQKRENGRQLVTLMILGYLVVWVLFGWFAYLGDTLLHEVVERSLFLSRNEGYIAAVLLLVAGIYQFTPLKEMCLTACRSPYTFLNAHWRGQMPKKEAFRLGMGHGWFCMGCCWTLMLLMFAFGGVNLGWMLLLGVVMAVEKSGRWGRYLTRPLGLVLIAWAILYLAGYLSFSTPLLYFK